MSAENTPFTVRSRETRQIFTAWRNRVGYGYSQSEDFRPFFSLPEQEFWITFEPVGANDPPEQQASQTSLFG